MHVSLVTSGAFEETGGLGRRLAKGMQRSTKKRSYCPLLLSALVPRGGHCNDETTHTPFGVGWLKHFLCLLKFSVEASPLPDLLVDSELLFFPRPPGVPSWGVPFPFPADCCFGGSMTRGIGGGRELQVWKYKRGKL